MNLMRLRSPLFLCVSLLILAAPAYAQDVAPFTDVPVTHPNYTAITTLHEQGIINGYEDGSFKPERTVTRAEMLKIVLLAMRVEPIAEPPTQFNDLQPGVWYEAYIGTATKLGIVGGYGDGSFQPNRVVTRVEGLKILLNAKKVLLTAPTTQTFTDVPINEWYAPYVQYVVDHHLLDIPGNTFGKDEGLRRKDIAQMIFTMGEEEQAAARPVVPWWSLVAFMLLWFIPGIWNLQINHSKKTGMQALSVLGGPFMTGLIAIRRLQPLTTRQIDATGNTARRTIRFVKQRYTYFRERRQLYREFFRWIDINKSWLFVLSTVMIIIFFVSVLVDTSIETYRYKRFFQAPEIHTPV